MLLLACLSRMRLPSLGPARRVLSFGDYRLITPVALLPWLRPAAVTGSTGSTYEREAPLLPAVLPKSDLHSQCLHRSLLLVESKLFRCANNFCTAIKTNFNSFF